MLINDNSAFFGTTFNWVLPSGDCFTPSLALSSNFSFITLFSLDNSVNTSAKLLSMLVSCFSSFNSAGVSSAAAVGSSAAASPTLSITPSVTTISTLLSSKTYSPIGNGCLSPSSINKNTLSPVVNASAKIVPLPSAKAISSNLISSCGSSAKITALILSKMLFGFFSIISILNLII